MAHNEYLRRNLLVASAVGANAAATTALARLHEMKLPADLAKWRDTAPD